MGILPRLSVRILVSSLSTQTTSLPDSAKHAPATSPTYPVPTTAIRMILRVRDTRHVQKNSRGYHTGYTTNADSRRLPPSPAHAHGCRRVHPSARAGVHRLASRRAHALYKFVEG